MGIVMGDARGYLEKIINESTLDEKQKLLWSDFIRKNENQELEPVLDALKEDVSVLDFLTKNLEDKIEFLKSKNKTDWEKIMNEENQFINKIEN